MRLKAGVDATNIAPQVWWALGVCEMVYRGLNKELVVTALRDGLHTPGSFHYKGMAADIRTRNLSPQEITDAFSRIKNILDWYGFDVLLNDAGPAAPHIHLEFDPKAGDNDWLASVS